MAIDSRFYELAAHLQRGGEFAHFWISNSAGKQSHWHPAGRAEDVDIGLAYLIGGDIYFSVSPVASTADRSIYKKSHKADVAAVNCLWAEFDDKDFAGNAAGYAAQLAPAPSVTIHSGGGVHAYWLLKDTFIIGSDEAREEIDGIQKRWQVYQGGDKGVNDLARVLRVPGSFNHKYEPPREVEIKLWEPGRQYTLADLVILLPPAPPKPVRQPAAPNDVDDRALLELARAAHNGQKFDRLWNGDFQRYYANDQSTADLALCTFLAFWTGRDETRIDSLFQQSGLYRKDKWSRRDYRERTIDKACRTVFDVYTPGMDNDAVAAAMAAVGLAKAPQKVHTNGHSQNGAAASPAPASTAQQGNNTVPPAPQRLVDLQPQIDAMLRHRMNREDKAELAALLKDFFEQRGQLFQDAGSGLCYLQDEEHRVWAVTGERQQDIGLRRYLRDAGLNATDYVFAFVLEELTMAAMKHRVPLQQSMAWKGGALYIPCGPSFLVRSTLDHGLEKLPNGTDGMYFVANSAIPEWQPTALDDAEHPLSLQALQVAINTPPEVKEYEPDVQQTLLAAWLVAFMAGIRPLPLLATLGNKGGGKSMLLRSILKLVMGQANDLTPLTNDKRDYDTMVVNELLVGLDNVDNLPQGADWFFDSLATTATGGINKRRAYHTLAQLVNLPIVAAVMVSSRTASFARPDVAERTLPIFVRPFDDSERAADSDLLGALPEHRDAVLSWMAYYAVDVMDRRKRAPKGLPARFQDFARVVWAYCSAIGREDIVVDVLKAWRSAQSLSVGDADPLMRAIVEYLSEDDTGIGLVDLSAKELLDKLKSSGADLPFMGGGRNVAQRLRELAPMLTGMGILISERVVKYRPKFTIQSR